MAKRHYQLADGTILTPAKPEQMRWRWIGNFIKPEGVIEKRYEKIAEIPQRTLTSVGGIREDRRYRRHADKKQRQQLSGTPGAPRHIEEVSEYMLGRQLIARDERVRFDASKYLPAECNRRGKR